MLRDPDALVLPVGRVPGCAPLVRELLHGRWSLGEADLPALDAFAQRAADPRAVVFVAVHHGNFPSLEYLATVLRAQGRPVVAAYVQGGAPAGIFDAVYDCGGSLARLAELARRLPARVIWLQAHGRWSFLSQLVAAANPGLRVVQELWDWMDAFVDPAHADVFVAEGVFTAAEITMMRMSERWVRGHVAAFVHKHGGPLLDAVVADRCVPELRVFPAPPSAWMHAPRSRVDGPWRLVHAGQIKGSDHAPRVFGDLNILPIVHALVGRGMQVTAHVGAGGPDLGEYVGYAAANPAFTLAQRSGPRELIASMAAAQDLGLLLYRFGPELVVGRRHLQTALASKLFAYLAAGLPVVVSPELEFMASLVEHLGVGFVVDRRDVGRLPAVLDGADWPRLHANVARAQTMFAAERTCADALALMEAVA